MVRRRACPYCSEFHSADSVIWERHQERLRDGEKPYSKLTVEEKAGSVLGRRIGRS